MILLSRLCHWGILWADEDDHIASAIQALLGKIPYRDFWYDKPVLNIAVYWIFGASTGWRFSPYYFNQLLPPLAIIGACGVPLIAKAVPGRLSMIGLWFLLVIAFVIPIAGFGPRYILLADDRIFGGEHDWKDLARNREGQDIAQRIREITGGKGTIFIWGYWPKIFAYTRLPVASRYWDAQPLTGIPANQFEKQISHPVADEQARNNRQDMIRSKPDVVVDELGVLNPNLEISCYPELRAWFGDYRLVSETQHARIYSLRNPAPGNRNSLCRVENDIQKTLFPLPRRWKRARN